MKNSTQDNPDEYMIPAGNGDERTDWNDLVRFLRIRPNQQALQEVQTMELQRQLEL